MMLSSFHWEKVLSFNMFLLIHVSFKHVHTVVFHSFPEVFSLKHESLNWQKIWIHMFGCRNWSKTCLDLDAVWFSTLAALAVQCWKSDIIIGYLCSLVLSAGGQTLSIYYNLIVALVQFKYSCFLSGRQPVCVWVFYWLSVLFNTNYFTLVLLFSKLLGGCHHSCNMCYTEWREAWSAEKVI